MSRMVVLILVLLLIAGGIYYLSTVPREVPAKTVEIDVPKGGDEQ
ncbi:MAG: hypothetical protein V4491_05850 [Pseudomonadota bacterium]